MTKNKGYSFAISYSDSENRTKGVTMSLANDDISEAVVLFTSKMKIDKKNILGIVKI